MTAYIVTMERLGRGAAPAPFIVEGDNVDQLAEQVYRVARRRLVSRDIEVHVNLDERNVIVFAGFQVGGRGRIEPATQHQVTDRTEPSEAVR